MKIARELSQRLQDLWIAKRDYLLNADVKEGRAFKLLESLLRSGEDFAFRAQQQGFKKALIPMPISAAKKTNNGVLIKDVRIYRNKKFRGEGGIQVRIHGDDSAEVWDATTKQSNFLYAEEVVPLYAAIQNGKLWLLEE